MLGQGFLFSEAWRLKRSSRSGACPATKATSADRA